MAGPLQHPTSAERARLLAEIDRLQRQVRQLDLDLGLDREGDGAAHNSSIRLESSMETSSAVASTSRASNVQEDVVKPKKRAKTVPDLNGPLPPSLARAPKRHIALILTYEGWAHSGLAYQPLSCPTTLPTVEGVLFDALVRARLIEPIVNTDGFGCGFERCGRTDAGVSSSGQVVNLWVRSDLPDPMNTGNISDSDNDGERVIAPDDTSFPSSLPRSRNGAAKGKHPASVELPYVSLLNRHLPDSVRVLAWSPVSATFSSRFSCLWRHYKYFFSSSVTAPILSGHFDFGAAYSQLEPEQVESAASSSSLDWQHRLAAIDWKGLELDVEAMRDAASRLVGEHDFRNLCRVDPPKQLASHVRKVVSATIDQVHGEGEDMFVLNLRGSAFLYNQVRSIIALLFLVGARLEHPSIIERLLWTSDRTATTESMHPLEPGTKREVVDGKPGYEIGDDLPLILWQAGYNDSEFDWRIDSAPPQGPITSPDEIRKTSTPTIELFRAQYGKMNQAYTEQRLKAIVLKHHLAAFAFQTPASPSTIDPKEMRHHSFTYTPLGMGRVSKTSSYTPLLRRQRADLPEVQNSKWANGRGKEKMIKRRENQEESNRAREANLEKKRLALEENERDQAVKGSHASE
ncbi:BQ2448_3444 [Microbotryum intermedium]|uniref:BQ2448_3444 protein n=1 Tax=Microbotryum intermedium TaxID=269621 RepID=A0A238FA12_9BASI|nr:BQ2448_3444 [Microbotryum intermedium]